MLLKGSPRLVVPAARALPGLISQLVAAAILVAQHMAGLHVAQALLRCQAGISLADHRQRHMGAAAPAQALVSCCSMADVVVLHQPATLHLGVLTYVLHITIPCKLLGQLEGRCCG